MKKFFKFIGITLALLITAAGIFYVASNEALPAGKTGKAADALAHKMLASLQYKNFEKTEIFTWSFRGVHFYKWYKQKNIVEVSWEKNTVILNTKRPDKSEVYTDGKKIINQELIEKASSFFNNDSFWLVAPYKVFDAGTERRIVTHNGRAALLVTYTSGGSTPGDSYLWILNKQFVPTSFKMWTKIIPIGGVSATWEDWTVTESGALLAKSHQLSIGIQLNLENVKAYNE